MAAFYMNEGVFDLPDADFHDKTVQLLSTKLEGDKELSLVVCRARMATSSSLEDVVGAHVAHEAKSLRAFAVLSRGAGQWAGADGIDVSSRYRLTQDMAYQRQVHLAIWNQWVMFGVTGPLSERERCDAYLEHVLTTFRLRNV